MTLFSSRRGTDRVVMSDEAIQGDLHFPVWPLAPVALARTARDVFDVAK